MIVMSKILNNKETSLLKMLTIRLLIMFLLLTFSRWCLYLFNTDSFPDICISELYRLFFVGLRFDLNTLIIFNTPLIVLSCIPLPFRDKKNYKKVVDISFVITNSTAIALNLIDVIYFRYIDKRMCSELFTFFKGTDENQFGLVISFIKDFWYMFILFFIILFIIIILTKKTKLRNIERQYNSNWYIRQCISFILILAASVIGIRGGFQLVPISLVTAANYTTKYAPLVINTPFSIVYGSTSDALDNIYYFDDNIIDSLYSPEHNNLTNNRFIKNDTNNQNLVLIIMESFGQEMIGHYNPERGQSLTPFLDSIFSESLTFDGMSNGRRSIESLPSILAGIPSLMATDYPTSRYASNRIEGFGDILKRHGYKTAFFHGGNNGTMNFSSTSKSCGFDDYYGRDEYNNDQDYDGTWGIYDMAFLQYTANKLNEFQEPFASVIFTLSSHVPYSLPEQYNIPEYVKDKTPFEKTVRFTDDALSEFFRNISQQDWYENTLFVFVADHGNSEHYYNKYKNIKGSYKIPLAFYSPKIIEKGHINEIVQQLDINISIISALNIKESVFSFGRNIFDSIQQVSYISFLNSMYQYSDGEYFMQSDGKNIHSVYDIDDDYLRNNLYVSKNDKWNDLNNQFRLRLQQYNNRMNKNKLYISK